MLLCLIMCNVLNRFAYDNILWKNLHNNDLHTRATDLCIVLGQFRVFHEGHSICKCKRYLNRYQLSAVSLIS